ncbi:hypothetical protein [Myxococcus landrumensis]|uniref:Uncharacterized protein n=1 Tax=Myxococcus landrumensis TaxID=2813577 RepID=A0ABX7N013_9BACT|nr:hypothetical protein [Myxococcus landrumus]QSQ12044.1 hypothetical protein JY572_27140 [Myxococcus landrumus]
MLSFLKNNPLTNLIKKPLEIVGKVAETVSKVAGGIANIGQQALNFLNKPASEAISPITNKISEQVKKIPFIGKFLAPVVEGLMKQGATALLGSGPIGGIGAMAQVTSKVSDLTNLAQGVRTAADKVGAFANNPLGQMNLQNIMAHQHAALIR